MSIDVTENNKCVCSQSTILVFSTKVIKKISIVQNLMLRKGIQFFTGMI